MDRIRQHIAQGRALTNTRLGAERAASDAPVPAPQRVLDDLIEHDRILADERLLRFRDRVDDVLAQRRSASPEPSRSAAVERKLADEGTRAERKGTDAILDQERQRMDAVVDSERQAQQDDHRLEAQRQETDDQLYLERHDTDAAVTSLGEARDALAHAQGSPSRRGDVLAMVSHDLRSPLSIIAMSAHRLTEVSKEAATLEMAHDVMRAAARMERLLMDLLDAARIESGTLRLVKRENDVGRFVNEVYESYRPLFADRGVTLTVRLPADAMVASFDHDRVVQLLSNVLGNAMKFTPANGTVELRVTRRNGEIEFALADSGPGIAPNALRHVFKRFWQMDSNNRRGLGLGLHICEKIVEAHGGRIWAESELGEGATIRFTLPVDEKQDGRANSVAQLSPTLSFRPGH